MLTYSIRTLLTAGVDKTVVGVGISVSHHTDLENETIIDVPDNLMNVCVAPRWRCTMATRVVVYARSRGMVGLSPTMLHKEYRMYD
jgi:hypothetical protein